MVALQSNRHGAWFSVDLATLPEIPLEAHAAFNIKNSVIPNRRDGKVSPTLLAGYFYIQWDISSPFLKKYAHTIRALFLRPAGLSFVDYPNNRILQWNRKSAIISSDVPGIIKLGSEMNVPVFLGINYSDYVPGPLGTDVESLVRADNIANTIAYLKTLKEKGLHLAGIVFGENIEDESGFGKYKPTEQNSDIIGRFIDYARAIKSSFPELKIYAFDSHFAVVRGAGAVSKYWGFLQRIREAEVEEGKILLDGFTFTENYVYMDEKGVVLPSQLILDDTESLYRDAPVYRYDVWGDRRPNPLRAYLPLIIAKTNEIFGRYLDIGLTDYLLAGPFQISEADTSAYSDADFVLHFSDHVGIFAELGLDTIGTMIFGNSVQHAKSHVDRKGNVGTNYPVHEQLAQHFSGEILNVDRSVDYDRLKVKVYATRRGTKYFVMILNKDGDHENTIRLTLPEGLDLTVRLPRRSYTSLIIAASNVTISGMGN